MTDIIQSQDRDLIWCARAIARKDIRSALNHLKVEKDRTVACDGHRLHIINGKSILPVGWYLPHRRLKTMLELEKVDGKDLQYPNIDQVIAPADHKLELPWLREAAWYETMKLVNEVSPGQPSEDWVINYQYFTDTWFWDKNRHYDEVWKVTVNEAHSGVRLDYDHLTAIIMPMRGGL